MFNAKGSHCVVSMFALEIQMEARLKSIDYEKHIQTKRMEDVSPHRGVKAELDGAIVAEGEGDELPQLQALLN